MFYITNEESFLSFFFPLKLTVRINLVYSGSSIYGVDGDHFCETSGIKEPLAEALIRPVRKSKRWKHRKFFFFFLSLLIFMCMCVLPVYMHVNHMHAWCPKRSEKGSESPGS